MIEVVSPDWSAPADVVAFTTTRAGGCSQAQWAGLNLAAHVDDSPDHVAQNRRRLQDAQALPSRPRWLQQVHGIDVAVLAPVTGGSVDAGVETDRNTSAQADAAMTCHRETVCAVMTADCLPVFLCDRNASTVAVAHAGWRGLAAGVVEATVASFPAPPQDIVAAFGPAIGVDAYEVGPEVLTALGLEVNANGGKIIGDSDSQRPLCRPSRRRGHAYIDLCAIAASRLNGLGVNVASQSSPCTYADRARWYSHRRDGQTGRMASIIYLKGR